MLTMSDDAVGVCTEPQFSAIKRLVKNCTELKVSQDFTLPTGWLYFIITFGDTSKSKSTHGGISPEGNVNT